MLRQAGVTADHTTHVARGCGSRMIELAGVPEDQIRRLGHWQSGAMERHYLSALPRLGMRAMAGMKSFQPGHYFIKRNVLPVPDELKSRIFKEVDFWKRRYETSYNC